MIGLRIVYLHHSLLFRSGMANVAVCWVWNIGIVLVLWQQNRALRYELGV